MERLGSAPGSDPVPGGLVMDPLRYVLPAGDEAYQQALAVRSQHTHSFSRLDGLVGSLGLMVAFLMLRFLWNGCFSALARSQRHGKERRQLLDKVEEEIWVTLGGMLLLVVGWQCLLGVSGYCNMANTVGCLEGWPLIPMEPSAHKYYNIELGWYLQLLLKHALGLGLQDNGTMGAHHLATVGLVVLSYMLNLHLLGVMVFCILNASSPLLHISKLASYLELRRAKTVLFAAFAAVFFATRLIIFPAVIVKCAMYESLTTIRGVVDYFLPFWLAGNVLLVVLCAMQCVWFAAVLRILRAAVGGRGKELQREWDAADPAGLGGKDVPGRAS